MALQYSTRAPGLSLFILVPIPVNTPGCPVPVKKGDTPPKTWPNRASREEARFRGDYLVPSRVRCTREMLARLLGSLQCTRVPEDLRAYEHFCVSQRAFVLFVHS